MKINDNGIYRDMTPEEEAEIARHNEEEEAMFGQPTWQEKIEAQVAFTAMMTDTMMEE